MVARGARPGASGRGRSGRAAPGRGRPNGERATSGSAAGFTRGPSVSAERLRATVRPVVTAAGYDLEDLSVSRAGRRNVLRVVVDSDNGVSLDAVAELSRAISAALDSDEQTGGSFAEAYTLEVTSPGVDRPLTEPRHWRRNVGRLVRVEQAGGPLTGRIVAADRPEAPDAGVELAVGDETRRLRYPDLAAGRVQIEFGRPESPGGPARKSDSSGNGAHAPEPGKEEA